MSPAVVDRTAEVLGGKLILTDTRDTACEAAVQRRAELTHGKNLAGVAILTDASTTEVDRLNAREQHHRAQRGELGHAEVEL